MSRFVLLIALLGLGVAHIVAAAAPVYGGAYESFKYKGVIPVSLEDWSRAQSKIAIDIAWKKWVESERVRLQKWKARGGDRSNWIAGYMHDYFDPHTQKELVWMEDTPPPLLGQGSAVDMRRLGGWVFYYRMRNVSYVLLAARLYRLTGDKAAFDWARGQIDLYAANYAKWPLQTRANGKARLMGSSLDEAQAMAMLLPAMRLLGDAVEPAQLETWKNKLVKPSAQNLLDSFNGYNNIAVWQRATVASMALLLSDEALWHKAVWEGQGVAAVLDKAMTKDGFWNEGTFGYGEYVIYALLPFLHQASVHGRAGEIEPIRRLAHDLLVAPLAVRFPDGTLPNPGDNRGEPQAFKRYLLREAAYLLPTPVGVGEWAVTRTWPRLLVDWSPVPETVTLPMASMRLGHTGFAMLRHQGWHLFLHFGQASANHAQYEALSFELQRDNGRIVSDQGTTVYSSPLHQNYFVRAAAHNVPMVDDKGQAKFALGQLQVFDPVAGRLSARQIEYRPGVSATRSFALGTKVLVDTVEIERDNWAIGGSIGVIHHFDCPLELPSLDHIQLPDLPAESGFGYWRQTRAYAIPETLEFKVNCKGFTLQVRVEGPAAGIIVFGKPPVLDDRKRAAVYLRYPVKQGHTKTTYTVQLQ